MSTITLIIILIIDAIILTIGWICLFRDEDIIALICFTLVLVIWIGTSSYMSDCDTKDEPTALDVYRGKTTLEITYRNRVAVDSVVVYKMK